MKITETKKVIITGCTGQIGSYMVDFLLAHTNHKIYGTVRRLSNKNYININHIKDDRFELIDCDITDFSNVCSVIERINPDYFINFAANSFVGNSWDMPINHFETNSMAVLYELEAIRKYSPRCRFYQSSSSEMFGDVDYSPQDEDHPLKPRSPYGASKVAAHCITKVYRESYNLFAVGGIFFNTESERRGEEFVTRKITKGVACIKKAIDRASMDSTMSGVKQEPKITPIFIGNINARRDWSHAKDAVDGVWRMLNQNEPKEYILSSNETHSVKDFIETAFKCVGIEGEWENEGNENACYKWNGMILVEIDPKFYRPNEVQLLYGDSSLARSKLGWEPKISFEELVHRMVDHDLSLV